MTETSREISCIPWGIAELPGDEGFLVTERPGDLRHVTMEGDVSRADIRCPEVENVPQRVGRTQAGLLDVKLGPDFAEGPGMVYLT